jgi:hypothetical protein
MKLAYFLQMVSRENRVLLGYPLENARFSEHPLVFWYLLPGQQGYKRVGWREKHTAL